MFRTEGHDRAGESASPGISEGDKHKQEAGFHCLYIHTAERYPFSQFLLARGDLGLFPENPVQVAVQTTCTGNTIGSPMAEPRIGVPHFGASLR